MILISIDLSKCDGDHVFPEDDSSFDISAAGLDDIPKHVRRI